MENTTRTSRPPRRDRLIQEREHDTYKQRGKLPDPTACSDCGAMFRKGRWIWERPPADVHLSVCPACHRVRDGYPGGHLSLVGDFARQHREEIIGLVRNIEEREARQHPLKRIMAVEETEDEIVVTTTDPKLARNIGDALHSAYEGDLDYTYSPEEHLLNLTWTR